MSKIYFKKDKPKIYNNRLYLDIDISRIYKECSKSKNQKP